MILANPEIVNRQCRGVNRQTGTLNRQYRAVNRQTWTLNRQTQAVNRQSTDSWQTAIYSPE